MEFKAVIRLLYGLEEEVQHRDFFASLSNAASIKVTPIIKELPKSLLDKQTEQIVKSKKAHFLDSTRDSTSQLHCPMTPGCNLVTFVEPIWQSSRPFLRVFREGASRKKETRSVNHIAGAISE